MQLFATRVVRRDLKFIVLSEKTWKSNHLLMQLQRQHFLLSYFKTSRMTIRCSTNWATGARSIPLTALSVLSHAKIFLKLEQHQAQVRHQHVRREQANNQGISLNIERLKKTVSTGIARVQLALLFCYSPMFIFFYTVNHDDGWLLQSVINF